MVGMPTPEAPRLESVWFDDREQPRRVQLISDWYDEEEEEAGARAGSMAAPSWDGLRVFTPG